MISIEEKCNRLNRRGKKFIGLNLAVSGLIFIMIVGAILKYIDIPITSISNSDYCIIQSKNIEIDEGIFDVDYKVIVNYNIMQDDLRRISEEIVKNAKIDRMVNRVIIDFFCNEDEINNNEEYTIAKVEYNLATDLDKDTIRDYINYSNYAYNVYTNSSYLSEYK